MKLIHISYGGPDRQIKDATGRIWHFEMHPFCGPAATNQRGDPADSQPGPRSPFWSAVTQWAQQGGVIGPDGFCTWTPEPQPDLVHLGGKNYAAAGSTLADKYGRAAREHRRNTP